MDMNKINFKSSKVRAKINTFFLAQAMQNVDNETLWRVLNSFYNSAKPMRWRVNQLAEDWPSTYKKLEQFL